VRELIGQKLAGQERLAREKLCDLNVAQAIAEAGSAVGKAESIPAIHLLETRGAGAYWSAWHSLPIMFPRCDLRRVPEHWRSFGARRSPLTGSPRLAVNPPNAILNYLYAVLESEARLAAAVLGLDPGLGFLHKDALTRDSLACDLMEPVRPQVDAFVLDWITHQPLRREWFFEQRDGNCRLMGAFAVRLSETAPTWARAIAPIAEWVVRTLWAMKPKPTRQYFPATRLTQGHRRMAKDRLVDVPAAPTPRPPAACKVCGVSIEAGRRYCASCGVTVSRENVIELTKLGRAAGHSPEARARQAEKQRRHAAELKAWNPSVQPDWLTEEVYREKIQLRLSGITVPALSSALGLSVAYAGEIRGGRQLPHPRHWLTLARLVRVAHEGSSCQTETGINASSRATKRGC
jgi:hypothetical protein